MAGHYRVEPQQCSHDGCTDSYVPHHWGAKQAERLGWFIQKNGDAWCPKHIPNWVAKWRAQKQKGN